MDQSKTGWKSNRKMWANLWSCAFSVWEEEMEKKELKPSGLMERNDMKADEMSSEQL